MTHMQQVWGVLAIFIFCPLLGGLPLIAWITRALTGRRLERLGTGNISVSAAFYHGGKLVGILAVLSEALKGIAAVLLARAFFPTQPAWELIALIALVMGRYWVGKGAGTTNVVWGYVVHDWRVALLVFLIGGISFTLLREKELGRFGVLILFSAITALLHLDDFGRIVAAIALAILIGWIYKKIPDDLDLSPTTGQAGSEKMFRFFRGDKAIVSLDDRLDSQKVGDKAATLSQLKSWGYPVPMGWVLVPGDDPEPLIQALEPSASQPLVVRSSAIGEDSEQAAAAGQYETVLQVTSRSMLRQAIARIQASYDLPNAVEYRRARGQIDAAMAVLIQKQVQGVFSGVAFSRDPITQQGDAVAIEALPGEAQQVVSGRLTPEQYRVAIADVETLHVETLHVTSLQMEGEGDVPLELIKQVALLARKIEDRYHGIPQDIEWSYDGSQLWLLQSRPITTLLPIWTRKIAAEVIPGAIRPLTWSINRPLTCGVWGEIFAIVLGNRSQELDFNETATLHYSRAYFNASLLGQIFRLMGLPAESLEFLTRGAKFSKPPLSSTLKNVPGLLRLLGRELSLVRDFQRDERQYFRPGLTKLEQRSLQELSTKELLERIEGILSLLKRATYYSILAPLSAALRQAVFRVRDDKIDNSKTPEVAALREIAALAEKARKIAPLTPERAFEQLEDTAPGREILQQFEQLLDRYGYLSQVGTDIAVPTWKEEPQVVRELFLQMLSLEEGGFRSGVEVQRGATRVQQRIDLKGRVTQVYSRLLAELRWCFVRLEEIALHSGQLSQPGDIFFLEFPEVQQLVAEDVQFKSQLEQLVKMRRSQFERDSQLNPIPALIYGNSPPTPLTRTGGFGNPPLPTPRTGGFGNPPLPTPRTGGFGNPPLPTPRTGGFGNPPLPTPDSLLKGIGASSGQITGTIAVLHDWQMLPEIDKTTILVVPYTDSGWVAAIARAGGLIAEVGGRLSHGAIVAREYGIPAVMDVRDATHLLRDGQQVRLDGQQGTVEILDND